MSKNEVFFLYPFCRLVKGHARSAIYDLELNKLHSISNGVYSFIEASKGKTKQEIYALFNENEKDIVNSLITSLIDKRFMRFVNKKDYSRFLPMQSPSQQDSLIDSFVMDIDGDSQYDAEKALKKISIFHLQVIQIRILYSIKYKLLTKIINEVNVIDSDSIEIVVPFATIKEDGDLYKLLDYYKNITNVYIWDAKSNKVEDYKQCRIIYMENKINSYDSCGLISSDSFLCSKKFYLDAKKYNTCLAKKCAIDKNGIIKNCPYISYGFGHIDDITSEELQKIVQESEFTKLFNIKKDDIHTCNVCEFRYACFDCRVFISEKDNLFSKPLKCGYNPHTAKWNNK